MPEKQGREKKAARYREYVEHRVQRIRELTADIPRPRVYYCLGHPLIAMFGEKMESCLAETAGAELTNLDLNREKTAGYYYCSPGLCAHGAPDHFGSRYPGLAAFGSY